MSLLVRMESHTYPVKISWPHQKAWIQFEMRHPGESALGYKLKRSETASSVLLLDASTEEEPALVNTMAGFCFIPWFTLSLVASPCKFLCFNFSSLASNYLSTDFLGCWETRWKEGRGNISGVFGSDYRHSPSPHLESTSSTWRRIWCWIWWGCMKPGLNWN